MIPQDGRIEDFYREAQTKAWAGDEELREIPDIIGGQQVIITSADGSLTMDERVFSAGAYLKGEKKIWFKGQLLWFMDYHGYCAPEAVPFLRAALRETAIQRTFVGGRGDLSFESPDYPGWLYTNAVVNRSIRKCGGADMVTKIGVGRFANFSYSGGLMITDSIPL